MKMFSGTAIRALIQADTMMMWRSWLIRGWVGLALVTSVLPVLIASGEEELVSDVIGGWLATYFIVSALIAGILGVSAVTQDAEVAADTILTRAVTRYDYVSAKLLSRVAVIAAVHLLATLPLLLFARRFGLDDATSTGLIMSTATTGVMLLFVASLGVALGVVLRGMVVGVVVLVIVFSMQGLIFDLLNMSYLSSNAVLADLPEVIRGELSWWNPTRILLAFGSATLALAALAAKAYDAREF
jgi:hypothetical protein